MSSMKGNYVEILLLQNMQQLLLTVKHIKWTITTRCHYLCRLQVKSGDTTATSISLSMCDGADLGLYRVLISQEF